jgi:hypothetical protein
MMNNKKVSGGSATEQRKQMSFDDVTFVHEPCALPGEF